jgi:type IV pilus biogenesis protein CpaD/CtpE
MKNVLFLIMSLFLAGCVNKQPKTYSNKIKIYKKQSQKVLYIQKEEKPVAAECYITNFKDTLIAENRLNARMIQRLNEHEKAFIPEAYKELETIKRVTAALKTKISKEQIQDQDLKSIKKGVTEIKQQISKRRIVAPLKNINQRGKNEYSRD